MRRLKLLLVLTLALISFSINVNAQELRVLTFNIRYNNPSDGENAWPNRKDNAASMIKFYDADIVGLQEALVGQVHDLEERLLNYAWFGVGRDDGAEAGEFMTVFYLKDRFDVLEESTFWLSQDPTKPGKGWDAACNRVVTWGKFKERETGRIFYLFNTHFDHVGEIARRESAKLVLTKIHEIAGDVPAFLTGDFNSTPDSEPYKIITEGLPDNPTLKLIDTKKISLTPHHGPYGTMTDFELSNLKGNKKQIDYIFITGGMKVLKHATLSDTFDGYFPSDHMPVLVDVIFEQ